MQAHDSPRRWSTQDVDQRSALAYWVDTVCDRFIGLDIDTPLRGGFRAQLERIEFGPATANFLQVDRQQLRRTRARIARSSDRVFVLLHVRAGQVCLSQYGRTATVRSGEAVLMDGGEPYSIECPQTHTALALRLPDEWLRRWLPRPAAVSARTLSGDGWSSALNASLASLQPESCSDLALPPGTVVEQIAVLLALAAGRECSTTFDSSLFSRLMTTLRDRLHEPELAPSEVARLHGISKRSLHYAFAAAGTTFSAELMRLRLQQARQMLTDARFSSTSVTEIAMRCGFSEGAHFARRFRERFGRTPRESRRAAGSDSD